MSSLRQSNILKYDYVIERPPSSHLTTFCVSTHPRCGKSHTHASKETHTHTQTHTHKHTHKRTHTNLYIYIYIAYIQLYNIYIYIVYKTYCMYIYICIVYTIYSILYIYIYTPHIVYLNIYIYIWLQGSLGRSKIRCVTIYVYIIVFIYYGHMHVHIYIYIHTYTVLLFICGQRGLKTYSSTYCQLDTCRICGRGIFLWVLNAFNSSLKIQKHWSLGIIMPGMDS